MSTYFPAGLDRGSKAFAAGFKWGVALDTKRWPQFFVFCAAAISLAAIAGWLLDIEVLRNTFSKEHGLRFSTATIQLMVAAAIVWGASAKRKPLMFMSLALLTFLPIILIEVAYGFSAGQTGMTPFASQDAISDPPSPIAALCLSCICITMLADRWHQPLPEALRAWPALISLVLCVAGLATAFWRILPLFEATPFARMSPNAAAANAFLALAALGRPRRAGVRETVTPKLKDQFVFAILFVVPVLVFFEHTWTAHVIEGSGNHAHFLTIALISSAILAYVLNVMLEADKALHTSERVLQSNAELFERVFANAPVGLAVIGLDGTRIRVNKQHCINSGRTPEQLIGQKLSDDIHPDDLKGSRFSELAQGLVDEFERDLRKVHPNGRVLWLHVHATLQRDITGKPSHIVVLCHDIDESRQREQAHALIVGEMNHRIKNTLATIQGLVREISERTRSPEELPDALQERLLAISRAHDSLMQANWEGLTLKLVFQNGFFNVFSAYRGRFDVQCVDVELGPQTSVLLSLVLHELMTNSIKYGAMYVPAGRLSITSSLQERHGERILELVWSEQGCQGVAAPAHRGFGSFMLDRGVKLGLGGTSEIVYRPEGLLCTLQIPLPLTGKCS